MGELDLWFVRDVSGVFGDMVYILEHQRWKHSRAHGCTADTCYEVPTKEEEEHLLSICRLGMEKARMKST